MAPKVRTSLRSGKGTSIYCKHYRWTEHAFEWLPDLDLNQDKQIQSLLCYHYTIGHPVGDTLPSRTRYGW